MRLFIAVDLPGPIRSRLGLLMQELRRDLPGLRWVRPEGIHLTMSFLGEVQEKDLPRLDEALQAQVPGAAPPHEVQMIGIGLFPESGRPRVLWVGLEEPGGNLSALQSRVQAAVEAADLPGVKNEARPFRPHLTLARFSEEKPHAGVAATVARHANQRVDSFTVSSICLFESILRPQGAQYRKIQEYPL